MPENGERLPENNVEKSERSELKSLERKPERGPNKEEIEIGEKELAQRGEAAERRLSAEREKREADLNKQEKEKDNLERAENKSPRGKVPIPTTKKELQKAYHAQITKVQSQLPRASRTFSKVVHNPVIEKVSDATGKTIFRPSALLGGAIFGLIAGIAIYLVVLYLEYAMPTWVLPALLIVGAIFGVLVEFIFSRFQTQQQ